MKINRLELLRNVIIGLSVIFGILYIVYYFTYVKETFITENNELTNEDKDFFFTQYLQIRNILINDFNVIDPLLMNIKINNKEVNITNGNKKVYNLNDINDIVYKNITIENMITLADIIGYHEIKEDFMKELKSLPVNEREERYLKQKNKVDVHNNINVHSWGYIGSIIEKYLVMYPFYNQENLLEQFNNSQSSIIPLKKIDREPIEQRIDTLLMKTLPDPNKVFEDFNEFKNRKYELSLANTKQVLKALKCYIVTKMDNLFDDTIDCDEEKINEFGVSIVGYNVFSL